MSSLSEQWNGVLPSGRTSHFHRPSVAPLGTRWSPAGAIGFSASLFALLCGTRAALALRHYQRRASAC